MHPPYAFSIASIGARTRPHMLQAARQALLLKHQRPAPHAACRAALSRGSRPPIALSHPKVAVGSPRVAAGAARGESSRVTAPEPFSEAQQEQRQAIMDLPGAPANGSCNTSGGSASPGPARGGGSSLLRWVQGHLSWLAYQGLGVVMGLPPAIKLLFNFIKNPRKTLYRKDRSQLQFPDPLPGLTHEFLETQPGIKLHVVRTSKGSGKPLMLLVHGFPEAWHSWRWQMAAFRDEYEVVAMEPRGYGESSKPAGRAPYRMDRLAGDVNSVAAQLLKEVGQEQLVLVGHDWGGNLCWAAAYLAPAQYRRLAILAVPHPSCYFPNLDLDQFRRSWYIMAFQLPLLPEACLLANDYEMIIDCFTKPPLAPKDPAAVFSAEDLERYKQAMGRPGAATATINFYRGLVEMQTRSPAPELQRALKRKLSVPTLMLWAENDAALGQQLLRGTERYVERLRVHVLPGCSHWIQQEQPEETNRLLRDFLAAP